MTYASFHGQGAPDPASIGLAPLHLVTEDDGATWDQTRAKMLRECSDGCVLDLEKGQDATKVARLVRDCQRAASTRALISVGSIGVYTPRPTNRYPADPDKPLATFDDDAAVAKVLAPVLSVVDADAYWAYPLPNSDFSATGLLRAYRQSIIHHRQVTRLLYGKKPIRWWFMAVTLDGQVLPKGTVEGCLWLFKELCGAGDSLVIFQGTGPWMPHDDQLVECVRRIVGN